MLDEARIRYCQWDYAGGSLEYDISYLHPDGDLVIQTYEVRSVTHDGKLVYASDFALYRAGSIIPADFPLILGFTSNVCGKPFLPSNASFSRKYGLMQLSILLRLPTG